MSIKKELFGKLADGREVYAYTLENAGGMRAKIITYGGAVTELFTRDRNGQLGDIACGFNTLDAYVRATGYQGAICGRVANRIGKGRFMLDGVEYQLAVNDINGHLHGGNIGFNRRVWEAEACESEDCEPSLTLSYISPDGEENYPGRLEVTVKYTVTNNDKLKLHYRATTDKRTVVNLTNHTYFNLNGYASGDILSHELLVNADSYNEINEECIPDGTIAPVMGTPFDFRVPKPIGRDLDVPNHQIDLAGGYDHNFVCNLDCKDKEIARLYSSVSGRQLSVVTNQPCMQLYIGNMMGEDIPFKGGVKQQRRHGLCLETQAMPDSPNHNNFTDITLSPDEVYDKTTVYSFTVK